MVSEHIVHSIPPTFDENSRVLVLGSIPSPKSREMQFNYGHPQNRFWRVLARIANEPVPSTNERKRDFCLRHHIALWDVLAECDIEGASDASIKNAKPNNLKIITDAARIEAVFCTGAKAHDLYRRLECEQTCGLPATKLPSTSPANAACSLEKLVEAYGVIFEHEHVWTPPTLDVPRVVELERQIDADGTSLAELMDRAGTALAKRVSDIIDDIVAGTYSNNTIAFPRRDNEGRKPTVTFLCGSGNNGGDGWVAAEKLIDNDIEINMVTYRTPDEIRAQPAHDAAVRAIEALESAKASVLVNPNEETLASVLGKSHVIVDCILGTGFDAHEVKEPYRSWISLANNTKSAVKLACDVPSGVSAQHGSSAHERFIADETITMIAPKPGLSAEECGTVRMAPLAYIEPYFS